jgi:hypothetical protein
MKLKDVLTSLNENNLLEAENKSASSKSNLKDNLTKIKNVKLKLKDVGYAKNHKNFEVLENTWKEFLQKGTVLSNKVKDVELKFDFETKWYDGNKASISGYVGAYKSDIITKFREEYDTQRKEYKYGFIAEEWVAGKLKEMFSKTGVTTSGGSSNYRTAGSSVYIYLTRGELQ